MYGRHYESMYTGSMMGAGSPVFAVWGYVISHQKPSSDDVYTVELNSQLMSVLIGEKKEVIESVLDRFQKPDPKSRIKDEDGRKLEKVGEYLYRVVNGAYYAKLADDEARRSYNRLKQRQHRAKSDNGSSPAREPDEHFPATEKEAISHAAFAGVTEQFAADTWHKANGRGGYDAKDVQIRNWRSYLKSQWVYEQDRQRRNPKAKPDAKQIEETIHVKSL